MEFEAALGLLLDDTAADGMAGGGLVGTCRDMCGAGTGFGGVVALKIVGFGGEGAGAADLVCNTCFAGPPSVCFMILAT